MKKRLLLIILLMVCLVTFTGCDKGNNTDKETIVYKDSVLKLKSTFEYEKEDGFEFKENVEGGKYAEITFTNKTENLDFDMYYTKSAKETVDTLKESRKDNKYFKEYTFGDFSAYTYGEYNTDLYLVMNLKSDDKDVIELFVSMELDSFDKNAIVNDIFNKKVIQEFFNSIKLTEE